MKVLKFGGTSVGSEAAISRIIGILKDPDHAGKTPVVVVSAFSRVTDTLIDMARKAAGGHSGGDAPYQGLFDELVKRHQDVASHFLKGGERKDALAEIDGLCGELGRILEGISLLGEISARTLDLVMSFGERLSASLLARVFTANGIESAFLDTRPLIKAGDRFGNAPYLPAPSYTNIRSFFKGLPKKKAPLQVATGFIASTMDGQTVTLGRGGSDLTAAIFGAALKTNEVEIWTDVDGILTADPRMVKNAFRIDEILYAEAMEISHFGAKVLFPPTVKPALEQGIPISIRNTFNPEGGGTRIVSDAAEGEYPIRGISSINHIALVRIQGPGMVGVAGFSARVFGALARRGISVILITQSSSEYSICFAVLPAEARHAENAIEEEFAAEIRSGVIDKPVAETDLSIIAVVGSKMKSASGISGKLFHALGRNGINVVAIAQGSSEINISAVIARQDEAKALNAVHEAFFHATVRSVNLFLMGAGLIGGTLLEQIASHRKILAEKDQININLIGVANDKRMLFNPEGLDPLKAKALVNGEDGQVADKAGKNKKAAETENSLEPVNLKTFVEKMIAYNLPNACFCDCTASDEVSALYAKILSASIPVVTPNKRANSGKLEYYRRLTGFSRDRGIPYLYETTVCAGLPVISTLRDLYLSGDRVRRIEAVLSGTLSFIFNNFDGAKPFSALVREAKAKGYTEPDPRDDLNAMDAARKALILARECGLSLEFANVAIEPILPRACFKAKNVDAFFKELEKSDAAFEKRRAEAAAQGKALRYVAVIEEGAAKLALRPEAANSPFRSLVDSDNMVVITTDRYSKLPMVIKGPGAGAQVTAGGIFADIARIARPLV
ncbi:MAG: bifunctional aspartate kinase/homoserine dehydrogenase I [Treponema sp.]|jgi:aspartokinase/homoserine dehydrogenase 1|nr:bifunctional aspartate kinase/homoserine dehydrogenase I [Treponema sp.]